MTSEDIKRLGITSKDELHSAIILISCILGAGLICLFSSCDQITMPARAEEVILKASWYSVESLKKEGTWKTSKGRMANNEIFNDNLMCCANRLYPLGTMLRVTNLASGKSVIVRTTDRIGKRFARTRIDLSKSAFEKICDLDKGLCKVMVEVI